MIPDLMIVGGGLTGLTGAIEAADRGWRVIGIAAAQLAIQQLGHHGPGRPGSGDVTVNGRHVHHMSWPLHEVGALLESRFIHPRRSWVAEMALTADEATSTHLPRSLRATEGP